MKIKEYLETYGIRITAFAKRCGMSSANLHRIMFGGNIRLDLAYNIIKISEGKITLEDLYKQMKLKKSEKDPDDKPKKKKAKKTKEHDL